YISCKNLLKSCKLDLAWYFLKKLMMANVTARNVKCTSVCELNCDATSEDTGLNLHHLLDGLTIDDTLNPLDIVTALFLCSDGFVQQEMALKMSMCQFSVPLLLPNCDTKQSTLMLWAMRDIVKKYRPQSLSESMGFIEEQIVLSKIPMISFVRLGECSLSKSEMLNKVLSNSQQYHDTFVHREMECGDSSRRISNGMAEITWYLPCGNKNIDVFNEPVAVANLRGDIASLETEYSFLCQTSARFSLDALKKIATKMGLTNKNVIIKTKQKNDAEFIKGLRETVNNVIENTSIKMPVEQMADVAHELGILVDEDCPECQFAKKNADAITEKIQDTFKYKEENLPLQVGSENLEDYKASLKKKKRQLRKKQNSYDISDAMSCFASAISSEKEKERRYFLKWLRINLDNLSREKLSDLREQYKRKCENSETKKEIKDIDRQLSSSSLGTEHFFREMGQLYEASVSLPEKHPSRIQLQHLPKLCAELLLDGFPLELVDGDSSNIPLRWVSDVLSQLHQLVHPKNKILVVTVLGVQSTGKSTLLNTMFGVQFAVSSGRCTRGAFMLLIRISEDIKKILNCDFLVIIDTEGLKSPELAQLDDSYEHDNELATLVVGLSDITIINIAMENSTEMKDILQIVVHAFLRMKEVGKKPKCQFVHQNVSDVSAHEKNMRDRKLLLQQLNEMTQAAAKMERKEENKSFTDVMEYCPDTGNWYIPGLWNGNPPMAPVSAGYSEEVYKLKKNIIHILGKRESSANDISEFKEWTESLWNSVKHENFIFSFRNSLVADAYMKLCTEFIKWEWNFKKDMYGWVTNAETTISNFGTVAVPIQNIGELLNHLKTEASIELSKQEKTLLDNLTKYFKQKEGHVHLVERYKEVFANSAKSLRKEIESSVINQLTAAADIKQGMQELDRIKKNHTKEIENRVCELIEECQKKKVKMTDQDKGTCQKKLEECGKVPFQYTGEGWIEKLKHNVSKVLNTQSHVMAAQKMADDIIAACQQLVTGKMERKNNYHDTYIQEILHTIDNRLHNNQDLITDIDFEVSLKQHICGKAARQFQKMHEDFLHVNDPYICLSQNKTKFCADFKDVFNERDQCQKKAEEFTNRCLRPAVEDFVNRSLGPDIISEMLTTQQFSSRMFFQYSVLLDLLSKGNFKNYFSYICVYELYVAMWVLNRIEEHFSSCSSIFEFENRHIQSCISSINDAVKKAKTRKQGSLKIFVDNICMELGNKLAISQDALSAFMILNNANEEDFARWLTECVKEMAEALRQKFTGTTIQMKLNRLHVSPQLELFTKMIGCGKQCPFCSAPCEAGGSAHTEHWTSLHRPQALGDCTWNDTKKLVTNICSSAVISDLRFSCAATNGQRHPFKRYTEIYPDWKIAPDISLQASDYWKHIMAKFNNDFADAFNANPADIPTEWTKITKKQAEQSLKVSFGIK
uniref:Si:dkey-85k7.12 n=1 Tax=Sphaeramia orbicularis TaxID=375764 RepID=A0A673CH38_9TELE